MQRMEFANSLRGLAALSVLISHYFCIFWVAQPSVADLINAAPLFPVRLDGLLTNLQRYGSSLGPFGVALFFLISGFVIPFSLSRIGAGTFLARRVLRILPTYIVGFSITLLMIYICGSISGRSWKFSLGHVAAHYFPGLRDVLGVPMIDGIIWTLDVEAKFYLVCAASIALFKRQSISLFAVPIGLCIVGLVSWQYLQANAAWFDQTTVRYYNLGAGIVVTTQFISFMFMGSVFHYLYRGIINHRSAAALIVLLLSCYGAVLWFGPDAIGRQYLPAYLCALAVFTLAYSFRENFPRSRALDFLADVSYPLYVVHGVSGYVVLYFMTAAGIPAYVSLSIATALAIALAYLLHVTAEMKTRDYRPAIQLATPLPADS